MEFIGAAVRAPLAAINASPEMGSGTLSVSVASVKELLELAAEAKVRRDLAFLGELVLSTLPLRLIEPPKTP